MRLRERLYAILDGRNGFDALNGTLLGLSLALFVINLFLHTVTLVVIEYAVVILVLLRFFSRNLPARRRENQRFLDFFRAIGRFFKLQKNKIRDRKTHVYRKCPSCKTVLRLPRVKGEHGVTCPKCRAHFEVKV
ncbi:MAG: hypothetical protein IKX85_01420 [Clostridia bacterium]|nr:hypothetical protein [Clostridia bacterium]